MLLRSRLAIIVGSVSLALLGGAPRAGASHLVKLDEQTVKQAPPEPAQLPGQSPCIESNAFTGKGNFIGEQFAFVDVGSFASVAGECAGTETLTNTGNLMLNVIADPGDPQGPITLCFEARHSLFAESTAAFTAEAVLGSSSTVPITGPATIIRSPGAISIFSDGPTTIHTGTDADSQSGVFSVNGGDTTSLSVGESTSVGATGSGSATARGSARLSVKIGSCAGHGAPAVSHTGLGMLVALLGVLGALAVARRRTSGPHSDN